MAYENQDKCIECGMSIPHVEEGADPAASLCDRCYGEGEKEPETRKLASIQQIRALAMIPGADAIERATVLGWDVVVKKGEFQVGDKCVYFEIDSLIPIKPWSEFLDKEKKGKPVRLKTIRLRKQLSQGLVMPMSILGEGVFEIGDDVTEFLGVEKYEPVIPASLVGIMKGNFPSFIPKTDELRIQSYPDVLEEFRGHEVNVTLKIDGTSFTAYVRNGEFGLCSRNLELKESDNTYWQMVSKYDLKTKMLGLGRNIAIQAEMAGPGIQGNKLGLDEVQLFGFNVFDIDKGDYLGVAEATDIFLALGVRVVPVVYIGVFPWDSVEEMLKFANELEYANDTPAEGMVVRPIEARWSDVLRGRLSVKAISNVFLEKYDKRD